MMIEGTVMPNPAKHILLVEDDVELQRTFSDLLTAEGYSVQVVNSGKAALTALAQKQPNVMLLDIMLPGGMNGLDVLKWVRTSSENQQLPVIIFTNLSGEEKTAKEYGATSYVMKAETPSEELISLIKHLA